MGYTAAVLTISDKGFRGERIDTSGPAIVTILLEAGFEVVHTAIYPDEQAEIEAALRACATRGISFVVTTGGTGFSPRDVTPEATLAVVERETRGLTEAMRAESMKITPRGCLSRAAAGILGRTLIMNLPGSERAAKENLMAVMPAIDHGLAMLMSDGSADCAVHNPAKEGKKKKTSPSMDSWLREAKASSDAAKAGMFLVHNGVVRESARSRVREGDLSAKPVTGMFFSCDAEAVRRAEMETLKMPGIFFARTWLNEGELMVGDDIMYVMIGGDIRPHVLEALQFLVGKIKKECVKEEERYGN